MSFFFAMSLSGLLFWGALGIVFRPKALDNDEFSYKMLGFSMLMTLFCGALTAGFGIAMLLS